MENQTTTSSPAPAAMSLRAYARRRGISAPSVLRAVRSKRLEKSLVWVAGARGGQVAQIADPELADQELDRNTDRTKAPTYVKAREAARTLTVTPPVTPDVTRVAAAPAAGGTSLAEAAASEKLWKSRLAELDYRQKASELVEAKDIVKRFGDIHARIRTKLLAVPSKAKSTDPTLTLQQVALVDRLLREALEDIANGSVLRQ